MLKSREKSKHRKLVYRRKHREYRGDSMPLWLDKLLNFVFKETFGIILFFLLVRIFTSPEDLLTKIGFLVFLSLISSIVAMFLSFLLIRGIEKLAKYPKSGLTNLNGSEGIGLVEVIKMILNALVIATGLIYIVGNNGWWFLPIESVWGITTLYIASSLLSRGLAIIFARLFLKSNYLALALILGFGALIISGAVYFWSIIQGGTVNG